MFSCISSFIRRHKRKFIFLGGMVGSIVVLNIYFKKKLNEWNAKQILEHIEQLKRQSHFDGTIQTCDTALLTYVTRVREIICEATNVNDLIEELKTKPSNKVELWEELKIMIFTEAVGEVYAQCLLIILLRVQLCILAGYMYADSQKNKAGNSEGSNLCGTPHNRQSYLSHFSSFLGGGIKDLMIPVEDAVRQVFRGVKLDDKLKLRDYNKLFQAIDNILTKQNTGAVRNIAEYLMIHERKDKNENCETDEFLNKICFETKDVLECEDFKKVLTSNVEHGIALLMDRMSECFMHISSTNGAFMNPNDIAVPLAKAIPVMHAVFNNHKPDEQGSLINTILQQECLKTFSANLYEAFSQELP